MSSRLLGQLPELQAMARAARQIGIEVSRTKEELERLITMIVRDEVIEKKKDIIVTEDGKEKEIEREIRRPATIEDMISALLMLVLQDEKFRRNVPSQMLQQLMMVASAVRNYERRSLDAILPAVKSRVRQDLIQILHKAYPSWQSLIPDATSSMLEALEYQQRERQKNLPSERFRELFFGSEED